MLGLQKNLGAKVVFKRMLQDGSAVYRLFRSPKDPATTIPLRIYGDGAEAQQHFEIMTLLPLMSISKSTLFQQKGCTALEVWVIILVCSQTGDMLRHIGLTAVTLLPKHFENEKLIEATDPAGAGVVFWMLMSLGLTFGFCLHVSPTIPIYFVLDLCLGLGLHPEVDLWGRPFDLHYYPNYFRKKGTPLAGPFKFVLDGVQGDADFIAAIFELNRCL